MAPSPPLRQATLPEQEDEPGSSGHATRLFSELERATDRHDHVAARRLQRELKSAGYSVVFVGRRDQP